jgi:hypothetical protein
MTLESGVFKISKDSPLSWDPHRVEIWLHEQSLSFVADAFKAENLNDMTMLQLDDVALERFEVCASSLKISQQVCSAVQQLRAASLKPKSVASASASASAAAAGAGGIFHISSSDISEIPHAQALKGGSGVVK